MLTFPMELLGSGLAALVAWLAARRAAAHRLARSVQGPLYQELGLTRIASSVLPLAVIAAMAIVPLVCALALRTADIAISWPLVVTLAIMVVCAWTDLLAHRIFNDVVLVGLVLIVGLAYLGGMFPAALLGVAIVGGAALLGSFVPGALSGGDVKLCIVIGAGVGAIKGIEALVLSFLLQALFGALMVSVGRLKYRSAMPVAPFLLIGLSIALIVNPSLERYLAFAFVWP
jgi:leader peptidase (prepilin peptidase)/N-methyltransferase